MARVSRETIEKHFGSWEHPYRTFEHRVNAMLPSEGVLVDAGCGRTAPVLRKYCGRGLRLIGLDYVDFPESIPGLELYNRGLGDTALSDESVDVVMARSVMEHVSNPREAYAEVARILRPGGRFVFLTANLWDYGSLIAYAVPNRWHPWIVRRVEGRAEHDTFPVQYKSNTKLRVYQLAKQAGLNVEAFEYLGQYPNYLLFNGTLFRIGAAYEKFLARHQSLNWLRGWILVTLRK